MLRFVFKTFGNPKARILRGARTWLCINAAYLVFKGWKWILADKSWLNHLKKKNTHSRFFVLLLLRVRQVSPLSRVRRRTNAERNATTERRRARTRNHIKVTLIPRFHLCISFYINHVFTYISFFLHFGSGDTLLKPDYLTSSGELRWLNCADLMLRSVG